jgi:[ribosomal protein S5]-alanine N-acetyltransferase
MTGVEQRVTENGLALRALGADDLGFLDRLCSDPDALGPFEWPGFGDVRARRRRWEQDGYAGPDSTVLAVVLADGTVAGIASWSTRNRSQPERGVCYEIGLALLPEHRGHGLGTAAQRLLVDYSGSLSCTGSRPSPSRRTSPSRRPWNASALSGRA